MKKDWFKGHNLIMLLCMVPMILAVVYFLGGRGSQGSGGSNSALILMLLLCPLMHLFMMGRGHSHSHRDEPKPPDEKNQAGSQQTRGQ